MENKSTIIIIVSILLVFIIGAYKVYEGHIDKLYLVVNNKIKESARKCYLENKCSEEITLKDLIDRDYIDVVIDPVSKEEIDQNLCIKYENDEVMFCN